MGHFGRRAIARAWLWLALPALMLCYALQSALVLDNSAAIESPFYLMAPPVLLILAAFVTVIASQSIISGAFSVTQQAVQLGYLPRVRILHISSCSRPRRASLPTAAGSPSPSPEVRRQRTPRRCDRHL